MALPWFVLQMTGSAAQTGLAGSFMSLPQFLSGVLGARVPGLTARRSLLPDLAVLARMSLARLNAAFESISYLALLVGPALAGLLVAALGAPNVLWIDAATFAFQLWWLGWLYLSAAFHRGQ